MGGPPPAGPPPHNYLEVYGIPPTLSVLRARFLEDAPEDGHDRCADVDVEKLNAADWIPTPEPTQGNSIPGVSYIATAGPRGSRK